MPSRIDLDKRPYVCDVLVASSRALMKEKLDEKAAPVKKGC
ncbi:MAG: hypothetical protein PVI43_05105 [Candidatus Bathyarchaeota archaeon]